MLIDGLECPAPSPAGRDSVSSLLAASLTPLSIFIYNLSMDILSWEIAEVVSNVDNLCDTLSGGILSVYWSTKAAISLERVKIEEKLPWMAYRKSPTLFRFFGCPPYFYFRFRLYGRRDGRYCLNFARIAQQSVLDSTNRLSSIKPCACYGIVHRTDIFVITQRSCLFFICLYVLLCITYYLSLLTLTCRM